jgi:hypothetical protein
MVNKLLEWLILYIKKKNKKEDLCNRTVTRRNRAVTRRNRAVTRKFVEQIGIWSKFHSLRPMLSIVSVRFGRSSRPTPITITSPRLVSG